MSKKYIYNYKDFCIALHNSCEHCGSVPFSPVWNDGGVDWCLCCAATFSEFKISSEDTKKLTIKSIKMEMQWHQDRINQLTKDLELTCTTI